MATEPKLEVVKRYLIILETDEFTGETGEVIDEASQWDEALERAEQYTANNGSTILVTEVKAIARPIIKSELVIL